jgi:sugar phosphate isomerase/epimerase
VTDRAPPWEARRSRRDFLETLAWLGATLPWWHPSRHRSPGAADQRGWGIQLYTVRDQCREDLEGTLAALAAMGYREVEFAGYHGHAPAEVRAMLDRHGLVAPSSHVNLDALTTGLDQAIADAQTLGHHYLVLPWIAEGQRTPEALATVAGLLNQAGARLASVGMAVGYHNHNFEFSPLPSGAAAPTAYDLLLQQTDPALVFFELDLYWIRKGGRDALTYLTRHSGRFRMVHIKEMAADGSMADLGRGVMDWSALLRAALSAGVEHCFVEHDQPADPLKFAREAIRYLQTVSLDR